MTWSDVPALNATLNSIATVLLVAGYVAIRGGHRRAHQVCMVSAFCVSVVFLVGYVAHKVAVKGVHTPFPGEGLWRSAYYAMLISHIILAIAIVPLVLVTFARARRGDFERHRAIARWTLPLWLYVSVTGVLVYFMLYRWFV